MDIKSSEVGVAGMAVLAALWGLVTMVFWMWLAWRAVKAHERIADLLERRPPGPANP
jgi:hypothetical protein